MIMHNKEGCFISEERNVKGQNSQLVKIAQYIKQLKFRKKLFGVDEADVWKHIEKLNAMYETALEEERLRYELLLEERTGEK